MRVPLSDIKAVQGDSGHAQVNMVTDAYSHIPDDDQRKNAELFKEAFYEKKESESREAGVAQFIGENDEVMKNSERIV